MLLMYWKNFIILKLKIFIEEIAYFVCLILLLIILQAWFITFNLLVKSYSSTDSKSFCNLQHVFILKHFFMFLKETKMSPVNWKKNAQHKKSEFKSFQGSYWEL